MIHKNNKHEDNLLSHIWPAPSVMIGQRRLPRKVEDGNQTSETLELANKTGDSQNGIHHMAPSVGEVVSQYSNHGKRVKKRRKTPYMSLA